MEFLHKTVLLEESINLLNIRPSGTYVDATAGGGGHSRAILEKLNSEGKLVCIDQDPDAVKILKEKFKNLENVFVIKDNFVNINSVLGDLGIVSIDGIIFDLGVSSYQLDEEKRGFSYHKDSALDMRMSKEGLSAKDFVNSFSMEDIFKVIRDYGEEKYAYFIAKNIVKERSKKVIETTFDLVKIIKESMPQKALKEKGHPARKTFQAIRIYVNSELKILEKSLALSFEKLSSLGRMAVITFHSLEDRIVKRFFSSLSKGCTCPADFPVCVCEKSPLARLVTKKAIKPSSEELEKNPRSRSAKLRVCEKI